MRSIEKIALAPYIANQLSNIDNLSIANIVEVTFSLVDLPLTEEMHDALRSARNALVGDLIDSDQENYRQLAILRTLMVALLAKSINYGGAISGWEKAGPFFFYQPAPEAWWSVEASDEDEALINYVARISRSDEDLFAQRAEWPLFRKLTVPTEGLLGAISNFASRLGANTGEVVIAKVEPILTSEKILYDFVIMLRERPTVRTVIFTIEPAQNDNEVYNVIGWREDVIMIDSAEQVSHFLWEVVASKEVHEQIQRLIQSADLYELS